MIMVRNKFMIIKLCDLLNFDSFVNKNLKSRLDIDYFTIPNYTSKFIAIWQNCHTEGNG